MDSNTGVSAVLVIIAAILGILKLILEILKVTIELLDKLKKPTPPQLPSKRQRKV